MTEETFVKDLLASPFQAQDIYLTPIQIGKPGHKGGNVRFDRLRIDVQTVLLGDQSAYCTTFFDFYGLPNDFPGKSEATGLIDIADKAKCVQDALTDQLANTIDAEARRQFIPYVQMYEFEALLFSDPQRLASGIDRSSLAPQFQQVRDAFSSPEEINDDSATAPSKRISTLVSTYQKPLYGTLAALEIGLETIRAECTLFDAWLRRIEQLGQ